MNCVYYITKQYWWCSNFQNVQLVITYLHIKPNIILCTCKWHHNNYKHVKQFSHFISSFVLELIRYIYFNNSFTHLTWCQNRKRKVMQNAFFIKKKKKKFITILFEIHVHCRWLPSIISNFPYVYWIYT